MANEIIKRYFKGSSIEDDDINYFFQSDFRRSGNNIYDDT